MMMSNPFFGSQWNFPSTTRRYPIFETSTSSTSNACGVSKSGVDSGSLLIGSEPTKSASAVKIQKVFRGFLVRKNMKKIVVVKREIEEVEQRISKGRDRNLIQKDSKERLRVTETLMSMLFRLDSVRGVDSGVRDCRKSVIWRAIALQEKIDAIIPYDQIAVLETRVKTIDPATEVIDGSSRSEAIERIREPSVDCDLCLF